MKILSTFLLLPCLLGISHAQIIWGTATGISGNSDISTTGTLFTAAAFGGAATVNGVAFSQLAQASSGVTTTTDGNATTDFSASNFIFVIPSGPNTAGDGPYGALSAGYQTILSGFSYGGTTGSTDKLTLNNLTVGNIYQVELFLSDSRQFAGSGYLSLDPSSTDLSSNTPGDYTDGKLGQYVIGTFSATARSQVISAASYGGGLDAFEVRDLTATPEPSTSVMLLGSVALLVILARRRLV